MTHEWTTEEVLGVGSSFQECRILLTAAELDLFSKLKDQARTVDEIADAEGWGARGLRILMDALAAMGFLLKEPEDRYRAEPSVARLLGSDGDKSVLPLVLHRVTMWKSWSNLTDIIRTGKNEHRIDIESRPPGELEAFIGAMHVIGSRMAGIIADSLDLAPYSRLLDLGGASGTYTMAFLERAPHMHATLFDLPPVIEMARERLKESGYLDRVQLVAGDYSTDELPSGHDLVLLSAVIHSNSREENRDLYRRVGRAMESGGMILIRDYIMDDARTFPPDGAIFAVNMLAATRGGDSYTFAEVKEDLETAGFQDVRIMREGTRMDQLVAATKGR
jgi:hypothetical protein